MFILDNHMHLRPDGENVQAVKKFCRAGGTHLVLAHIPYRDIPITGEKSYQEAFQRTVDMAEKVRKETDAKVFVTVGPYPVDLVHMVERIPIGPAKEIMMKGMDLAAGFVEKGLAIAVGEIGRPHFPVSEEIMQVSNEILKYGMELAKDTDCPVVLHTESATLGTFKELAEMADSVGLSRERVVKHFCPPIVDLDKNHGLFPSVLASKQNIRSAISQGNRFLMETDYIDDPRRPGAVLGPATVPRTTMAMLRDGLFTEEDVLAVHKTHPEEIYQISID
ncbi:MAG: metal-dependent hydrolase [Methanomassiliicoccales archaeon]|nr:MAG: metal-dependent hydrolase [Methanomassiliicoccales archaeon]